MVNHIDNTGLMRITKTQWILPEAIEMLRKKIYIIMEYFRSKEKEGQFYNFIHAL
jgi:hypothetical protein